MFFTGPVMPLSAADYHWDTTGDGDSATGGSGIWDLSNLFWDPLGTDPGVGSANIFWPNLFDTAVFGGTAGTVTLGVPVTAGGLRFTSGGYTLTGSTLTLSPAAGVTSPSIFVSPFIRSTISSQISGTAGLTKTGNGTLVLTNNTNNYTGDTVINGGALVISNEAQLGASTNTIAVTGIAQTGNPGYSGGQLVLNGIGGGVSMTRNISLGGRGPGAANASGALVSIGDNTLNGNLVVASPASEGRITATHGITTINGDVLLGNSAAQQFYGNGNFIINGQVSGYDFTTIDRFIKAGNLIGTTLWLANNNNTFRQPLRIDSGTVRVSGDGALGRNGYEITNLGSRAVDLNGGALEIHTDSPDFQNRQVYNRGTNGFIFTDRALGGSGLNQTVQFGTFDADNATFYHRGRNGYNLTLKGTSGAGTTTQWSGGSNLTFNSESSGTLTLDMNIAHDSETTQRAVSFNGNAETVLTGAFLTNGSSNAFSVNKGGTGQMTLTNTTTPSTITGPTIINGGTLVYSSVNALPTGEIRIGNATTTSGALTYAGAGETISRSVLLNTTTVNVFMNASGSGAVTYSGAFSAVTGNKTLVLGGTNTGNNTISSAIPAAGGTLNVQKNGVGTWVLGGANLYTGTTTVTNGTLKIQDTFSGGSRNVLPNAGAIIFNADTTTHAAGGTFQYLGDGANASAESVGALTPTAGAGTVMVTAGSGGTAALTFASLGTVSAGSGVNFVTNAGASVTLTGAANVNGILNAHLFFNGADFAAGSAVGAAAYTVENTGTILAGGNTSPYHVNTADITGQTTATINAGIKFSDSRNFTLGAAQTLTLQNGGATVSGGILVTGGSTVTLAGGTGITSGGAADLVFRTDGASDVLNLNTPITNTTTGGWTKLGAGTLVVGAANANTVAGFVNINEGTVRMATGGTLGANAIDVNLRQGATLDLNGVNLGTAASATGSLDVFNGAGTVTNGSATAASLRIGEGGTGGYFSGLIQDGAGQVSLVKAGGGTIHLSGTNTFTGPVTLIGGNLDVTRIGDIGDASALGAGDDTSAATNAASLVFSGGTLRYIGTFTAGAMESTQTPSVSVDRLFTLAGSGAIRSFGSYGNLVQARTANHASLIFNNTGAVAFSGAGARTLTLGGDSLGDNEIALQLINNPNANEALTLVKNESGMWKLSNSANSYSGQTQIDGGALWAEGNALSPNSNTRLSGSGVLMTSGTFTRALGTAANQVQWNTNQAGGFAASTDRLAVNLGGAGATLLWGTGGIGNGSGALILSSSTSWADVDFQNGINLNGATRTVTVNDNGNTGLDYATISGVISNSTGTGGLTKNGAGTLVLGDANTYNGTTTVANGTLILSSIGNSTGTTASSVGASGGTLTLNGNTTLNLGYVGAGETATRPVTFTTALTAARTHRIDSSGSGALVLDNFTNSKTGNFTLFMELRGQNTDGNRINSVIGDGGGTAGLALAKFDGGVWILGNSANTFTGGVRADGGLLGVTTNASLGATGGLKTTTAASSNSTTITVADTTGLKAGMYVNGPGITYGDYITAVTGPTTFTISTARTVALGAQFQFGGVHMSNGGIFAADPIAGLTLSQPFYFNNNATHVFAGFGDITLNGAFQVAPGNNAVNFSNNLENGAVLTVNSGLTNYKTDNQTFNWRGYGSTVWSGNIANAVNGTTTTSFDIRVHPDATFTMEGAANTFSGTFTLGQGTLILNKKLTTAGTPGQFNFGGGVLQGGIALTGADVINNNVHLNGDPATFAGSNSIEITGTLTNNGADRRLVNNLTGPATLTLTGQVNLSEHATSARTLTFQGSGTTLVNGVLSNGTGTGASALRMDGTGTLQLTNQATYTGATTVNNGALLLSGANGRLGGNATAAVNINGPGAVTLDNSSADPTTANRLNAKPLTSSYGTLNYIGDANGSAESIGALTINSSQFRVNMTDNSAGVNTNTLTFASVNIANSGSALDLNGIANLGTVNKVIFTTATGLGVTNGILPRVYVNGFNDFAAYDVTNGVVAFSAYNNTNLINAAATTDTMNLTASATLTANRTLNALKINGTGLTVGGADLTLTLGTGSVLATGGSNTLAVTRILNNGTNHWQVASGSSLDVTGSILGGVFAKAGPGELIFTGNQYYNSTTNILGGTLKLSGGLNTIYSPAAASFFNLAPGATLDLNGNTQFLNSLSGPGAAPGGGGSVISSTGTGTFVAANGGTFGGTVSGNINVAKFGGTAQTNSNVQSYTGWTLIGGGTMTLRDDATLSGTSAVTLNYGGLNLGNNDNLQRANDNRVNDTAPVTMRGGTLTFTGAVADIASERMGAVTAAQGANTITINTNYGASAFANATLNLSSLTRTAGATVNFTSNVQLGTGGNHNRILFDTPLPTVLGGALGGWAIANSTDFAAYNSVNGVGVVGTGGYVGYVEDFASGNITNVGGTSLVGVTTNLASATTTTGLLKLSGGFVNNLTFSAGTNVLNLEEGGLLRSNNQFVSNIGTTATRGVLTAGGTENSGTRELVLYNASTGTPAFTTPNTAGAIVLGSPNVVMNSTVGIVPGMTLTNANFPAGTTVVSVNSLNSITLSNNATANAQNQTFGSASFVSGVTTSGSAVVTMNSTTGVTPGMTITGTGIPAGSFVVSVDSPTQLTLSQNATANGSALTFTIGVNSLIVNSVIADNGFGNAVQLVKSGPGITSLTANNTYTGGTIINQGTVNLAGSGVVIPNGGLTLNGGIVTMLTNAGQIHSGNTATLNGSSTLTLAGNNTLTGLAFNNHGGTGTPTVTTGGILTLSSSTPLTVTSSNPTTFPTINGTLTLGAGGVNTFNIGAITHDGTPGGVLLVDSLPSVVVNAILNGPAGTSINKTGAGLLQLGGASTFDGGVNVTAGGIVLGANSTAGANGPLGTGAATFASGTTLFVNDSSRVLHNDLVFAANPTFSNTGASLDTLTLAGGLTFNTLGTSGLVVNLPTPYLDLVLSGDIAGIGSVTSIGTGSGANTITKSGLGNITGINLTGINPAATINLSGLNSGAGSFSLLLDGDGTSSLQTVNVGNIIATGVPSVTIGRSGTDFLPYFATALNKTIAPASFSSLASGITLVNNNGYGLAVSDDIAFNTVSVDQGPTFSVSLANSSLLTAGLTLDGRLTGGPTGATANVFTKAGNGTLKLGNNSTTPGFENTFGGGGSIILVDDGILEVSSDAALGDASNLIRLQTNSLAEGLRISGTFATGRTINLNDASNGIDVTQGNTFTLNSALTFGTATNSLRKNDLGTLVLTQAQPGWDGVMTINQGILRITDGAALGSVTGNTQLANVGAALELPGGVTVADSIVFNTTNNATNNGINAGGAIRSTAGTNTISGSITHSAATTADSQMKAFTLTADAGAVLDVTGGIIGKVGEAGANRHSWVGFGGQGTVNVTTTGLTHTGTLGIYQLNKFGTGTLNLQVANAFSGRDVMIKQGTLSLNGAGTIGIPGTGQGSPGTFFVHENGTLTLDNTGTDTDNRLSNRALNFQGGNLNILGSATGTTETTTGTLTLNAGASVFTLDADAAGQLNFTTAAVTRNAGSSLLIRADGFGNAAAAGVSTIQGTGNGYTFIGQTGATGTTNKSILPWAIGDTSIAGAGTNFVTADAAAAAANTGTARLRLLNGSEEVANLSTANANVNLAASTGLSSALVINSLRLDGAGGGITMTNNAVLTLESGGLLALAGNTGISGSGRISTSSNREAIIHAVGDLDISVPFAGFSGGLTKSGNGTLTLGAGNSFTGTVTVNQGILKVGGGDFSLTPNQGFQLLGGNLDLNGTTQNFNSLFAQTGTTAVNDSFVANSGGNVINTSATESTLALTTANVSFFGRIGNDTPADSDIAVARSTAAGASVDWNLYSNNTYTGATLLSGGRTQLIDGGQLTGTSSIELSNATLLVTNSNISTEPISLTNRINDAASINLRGAMFQWRTRAAFYSTETLGTVTLGAGNSIIDFAEPGSAVNQADVTFSSFAQTPGLHGTVRFINVDGSIPGLQRLFINNLNGVATTNIGDGLTNHLIGGWATFEREFASYTPAMGVGAINTAGYAGYSNIVDPNFGTAADNIRISIPVAGSTTTLTADRTLNSLNLQGATSSTGNSVLDLGGNTLTVASGGVILSNVTDGRTFTVQNGELTAGALNVGGDLYLHGLTWFNNQGDNTGNRDITVGANIVDNGSGAVALVIAANQGRGTQAAANDFFLTGANTYTGGTWVNSGRIVLNTAGADGTTIRQQPRSFHGPQHAGHLRFIRPDGEHRVSHPHGRSHGRSRRFQPDPRRTHLRQPRRHHAHPGPRHRHPDAEWQPHGHLPESRSHLHHLRHRRGEHRAERSGPHLQHRSRAVEW